MDAARQPSRRRRDQALVDGEIEVQLRLECGDGFGDRLPHSEGYSETVRRKINEIGNAAWMLGEENWVHLLQRRVSYGCWDYIAVRKAEAPKLKPVYRIIQSLAREPRKETREKPAAGEVMAVDGGTPMATGPPGMTRLP